MKEFIKRIYYSSNFGRLSILPFLWLRNTFISEETLVKWRFKRMMGYPLNLNNPITINEKIQWLKLNDRSKLHEQCADKYLVREYIEQKIGKEYLIPLITHAEDVNNIDISTLPNFPIIMKTNHSSGGVSIIKNKNEIIWKDILSKFSLSLKYKYDKAKGEWQYANIKPRIVVEKLLMDDDGNIPPDYKLHCFNGKVKLVTMDLNRHSHHKRNFYDENWKFLNFKWGKENGALEKKPLNFDLMISIAEKLAENFLYVRVDLYNLNGKIYFGELTFHPASGNEKFEPEHWDKIIGSWLTLKVND